MTNIEVTGLHYYPIKSCAGTSASEVTFSELGVQHDREWAIVDEMGQVYTQAFSPKLAQVEPKIDNGRLLIAAPRVGSLTVSLERDPDAQTFPVTLWGKLGTGTSESPKANDYFSDYLGTPVRFLRISQPRTVRPECQVEGASSVTGFADNFPIQITTEESLRELNGNLMAAHELPAPMDRFRTNIVLKGAQPYDEDFWREIRIGDLRAFVRRACDRCVVPNIEQQPGPNRGVIPRHRPVTKALRATRMGIDPVNGQKGEFFGQKIVHVFEPGLTVKVGDAVSVVDRAAERNWRPIDV